MYRTILVPLDGSKLAEQALPLAMSVAKRAGSMIRLARVHRPGPPPGGAEYQKAFRESELSYLDAVASNIKFAVDVPADTTVLDGAVAPALCKYAERVRAGLVVLTTHGRGPLSRLCLGSTADELIRQTPAPLLVYRPTPDNPPKPHFRFRRIAVPLDGSDVAEEAIGPAAEMARIMDAGLTFLRIVEPVPVGAADGLVYTPPALDTAFMDELVGQARKYVDHVATRWQGEGFRVETRVLINELPAAAVLDAAGGHDLIAIATHGRSRVARFFLGSIADKVARGAACPVLVVRHPHTRPEGGKP
jgi:nucleotide-binding universal stress UspA family protein